MISLLQKTNVDGPDSEWPYGTIRDKTMSQSGTPVNHEVYSDIHQFFMKMMDEAVITPNNQFDNEYNGWQLYEALIELITRYNNRYNRYTDDAVFISEKITTISGFYKSWNITSGGMTELDFQNDTQTLNIVSFGKNNPLAPVGTIHRLRFQQDPVGSFAFTITINSTNAGSSPLIRKAGVTLADQTYTIPLDQTIDIIYTNDGWEIRE